MFDDDGDGTNWRDEAACLETDPEWFFPTTGGDNGVHGKRVCFESCAVRLQCLAYALEAGEEHGIWGGLSAKERAALKVQARRAS